MIKKTVIRAVIVIVIVIVFLTGYFYSLFEPAKEVEWGITFSPRHAEYLGFDWKTMFIDVVNDLRPNKLRLMAYWEDIEPQQDNFNFQQMDEMLIEAGKRNIEVVLVLGRKQPRWPECHNPSWYNDLPQNDKDAAQLIMVEAAANHFKQFDAIRVWQVENEPLFNFGPLCPTLSKDLLKKEIQLVRSQDSRPIMLTDSGELGRWLPTIKAGQPDIFGSTMYRVVHNPRTGYFKYPLPPAFFRIKAGIAKQFTELENFVGVELQAEPWFAEDLYKTDLKTQLALMNPKTFENNVNYARKAGFKDNYLWGVEWWYWLAHEHNDWTMWEMAKQVLDQ